MDHQRCSWQSGNGISYGGGMKSLPDAVQDDGMLDMTVLGAVSKVEF